jgi:hypothetical protein
MKLISISDIRKMSFSSYDILRSIQPGKISPRIDKFGIKRCHTGCGQYKYDIYSSRCKSVTGVTVVADITPCEVWLRRGIADLIGEIEKDKK